MQNGPFRAGCTPLDSGSTCSVTFGCWLASRSRASCSRMTSGPPIALEMTGSLRMHHSRSGSGPASTRCRAIRNSTARSICLVSCHRRTEVMTVRA